MKANDFFREYATALLVWQQVEEALFKFAFLFFANEDLKRVGAIYYSQESFSAKLKVADAVARVELRPDELKDWKKLKEKMEQAAKDRNALAHRTAVADFDEMGDDLDDIAFMLGAPVFAPQEIRRNRPKKYDAEGCGQLSGEFKQLAQEIDDFTLRCRSMSPKS